MPDGFGDHRQRMDARQHALRGALRGGCGRRQPPLSSQRLTADRGPDMKTASPIPDTMRAWVLGNPEQLILTSKPVPVPNRAEALVRIDAVAICATDLDV